MPTAKPRTRIQRENHKAILEAALEVFSTEGFRGTTLDNIAQKAGLSKPNLLYYFPSKEAIHTTLLSGLLDTWLDPLRALDPHGDPQKEILIYMHRKLEMSREMPRESRLFANEVLCGAPRLKGMLGAGLKKLVDEKSATLSQWMEEGHIAKMHPTHLIFSIWALTQHYADFETQVRAVLGKEVKDPYPEAEQFLDTVFKKIISN